MVDSGASAAVRLRVADSVLNHARRAIEIEDIDVRVTALEEAAEQSKAEAPKEEHQQEKWPRN
jgi:hypothetical protein